MKKTTLIAASIAIIALILAGCDKKSSPTASTAVPASQQATESAVAQKKEVAETPAPAKQEAQSSAPREVHNETEYIDAPAKPKLFIARPEVIDYQGMKVGRDIPLWVESVVDGDTQEIAKQLKLDGRKLWVISNSGPDLDFLKIWTDKVDIQSEVAQSISTEIGRQTIADIQASASLDNTTKKKAIDDTTTVLTNVRVNNLEKSSQYWIQTRTPKVANPQSMKDYIIEYTYFVVYSMEAASFKTQMEEALKAVATNTSQDSVLQQIITARIANSLLPANQASLVITGGDKNTSTGNAQTAGMNDVAETIGTVVGTAAKVVF